nr:uncharacterized protein LOC113804310 isoform X2 [Penaeus vannamei]
MKGEIRVLKQRLASSERARLAVFEEKCELEEEENDSRLMVQRLESQMEARERDGEPAERVVGPGTRNLPGASPPRQGPPDPGEGLPWPP